MSMNEKRRKYVVLTDGRATDPDTIGYLRDVDGYRVVELNPRLGRHQVRSKTSLVFSMVLPRVDLYRRALRDADVVVVFNWYFLTLLALERLRLVHRPRQVISLGFFIQDERLERIAFGIARRLKVGNEWFFATSSLLQRRAIEMIGIPQERTEMKPYRHADGLPARVGTAGAYIFTGGFTNRDYNTFIEAVRPLDARVVVQALPGNEFGQSIPAHVEINTEFGPEVFEKLLAASCLVVLPLLARGTSAGQSVLLQALQYGKPIVVTRHPGVTDLLGDEFVGYVEPGDVSGMHAAIERCLLDPVFLETMAAASCRARERIHVWPALHSEITTLVERTAP